MSAHQKFPQINSCQPSMGLPFKKILVDLFAVEVVQALGLPERTSADDRPGSTYRPVQLKR